MSQVPTLVVAPSVESRLGKQLLVEPLPARPLKQGLVRNTKGGTGESVPEDGVLVVGVEGFLGIGVSNVQ